MKKIILFAALLLGAFVMNAQHLDYNNLKNVDSKLMSYVDFTSYTASDGTTIKIGDYVEFGKSSADMNYRYLTISRTNVRSVSASARTSPAIRDLRITNPPTL